MPDYWVDTNCFIEPARGFYAFDLVPHFWEFLDNEIEAGRIASPVAVYTELTTDTFGELRDWIMSHRDSGLFVDPSEGVQEEFNKIADYVMAHPTYKPEHKAKFLDDADLTLPRFPGLFVSWTIMPHSRLVCTGVHSRQG